MITVQEGVITSLIIQQIRGMRFSNHLTYELHKIVTEEEGQISELIKGRLSDNAASLRSPIANKRLLKLLEDLDRLRKRSWNKAQRYALEQLAGFAEVQNEATQNIYGALPWMIPFKFPRKSDLALIVGGSILGLSVRDWFAKIAADDRARMRQRVVTAYLSGSNAATVARAAVGTVAAGGADGATHQARNAIAALIPTVTAGIEQAIFAELSSKNPSLFDKDVLIAVLDGRTTKLCRSLHGKRYNRGEGPYPPLHHRCRTSRFPALSRTVMDYPSAGQSPSDFGDVARDVPNVYSEWLAKQSRQVQDEILGASDGNKFRRGELDVVEFKHHNGRRYTLDELRKRSLVS